MKAAVNGGKRAEAWFEIRYNSNKLGNLVVTNAILSSKDQLAVDKGEHLGIAKRRFYEAEAFGLYDTGDAPKDDSEAEEVYKMYTAHRDQILRYEAEYGNITGRIGNSGDWIARANSDYGLQGIPEKQVDTLHAELLSSALRLMAKYIRPEYGVAPDFNPLNIQLASQDAPVLLGEDTAERTGSNADLLIGADGRHNILGGEGGNDLLLGGNQNDFLDGGTGDDTMVGGAGRDKMYGGSGNDTFFIMGEDEAYDIFNGGAGEDKILGGAGNDTIRLHHFNGEDRVEIIDGGGGENNIIAGTEGDDIFDFTGVRIDNIKEIRGGGGNDIYLVTNQEGSRPVVIEDKGGTNNQVYLDGKLIRVLYRRPDGTLYSPDRFFAAKVVGETNDLRVTSQVGGVVILNQDFQEGDFGINIIDEPNVTPVFTISGDLQLVPAQSWEFQYDTSGQVVRNAKTDSLGNAICDANTPAPGQNDYLYDSTESDHLKGGGGDDSLNALRGGSDILEGGSGRDLLTDFGENDNDQLFAEHHGELTALINAGEVAENLAGKAICWPLGAGKICSLALTGTMRCSAVPATTCWLAAAAMT